MDGKISSNARCPTVEWRLSNVLAAACLTDGKGSAKARLNNQINTIGFHKQQILLSLTNNYLTVGTKLSTKVNTISLLVDAIISDKPIQTP